MQALKKWLFKEEETQAVPCIFCNENYNAVEPLHYKDDKFYAITDINPASARQHILVITHQHIDNALLVKDSNLLKQMKAVGQKVLNSICDKKKYEQRNFRFGFHLPPFNTVNHIHLHCFIEPLSSWKYNYLHYGWMLNPVQAIIARLQTQQQLSLKAGNKQPSLEQ